MVAKHGQQNRADKHDRPSVNRVAHPSILTCPPSSQPLSPIPVPWSDRRRHTQTATASREGEAGGSDQRTSDWPHHQARGRGEGHMARRPDRPDSRPPTMPRHRARGQGTSAPSRHAASRPEKEGEPRGEDGQQTATPPIRPRPSRSPQDPETLTRQPPPTAVPFGPPSSTPLPTRPIHGHYVSAALLVRLRYLCHCCR